MIRFNMLAAAISMFIVFVDEVSLFAREEPDIAASRIATGLSAASDKADKHLTSSSTNRLTVSASIYFPEPDQTDDTPFITADGSLINEKNPRKHRWIAVSRNLLSRWGGNINYGDSVLVSGISKEMDGLYIVRDTMHRRIKNRIDILVGRDDNIMGFWDDVRITKMN